MHFVEAKGILSAHNGVNFYRGCTHGCIYCDSRSRCYQMKHDFEDVEVKINAPELLEQALRSKRKKCVIGTGAMSDPYNHCEEELLITRRCLEVIDRYGFGLAIQTKSARVLRDIDLFRSIHRKARCTVEMTMTTYDEALCRIVEPNVSATRERFEALCALREAGIPTVVWLTPLLPFLNDTEENLRGILDYCVRAGVKGVIAFDMGLTLREGDREYYYAALEKHFPGLAARYARTYGNAYELPSPDRDRLFALFDEICEKNRLLHTPEACFAYMNRMPEPYEQLSLFGTVEERT